MRYFCHRFPRPKNTADGNVYVDMPARFLGYYQGDAKTYLDLAAWRAAYGWDRTSVEADMRIEFDPATLRLTLSSVRKLPKMATSKPIRSDLLGVQKGAARVAGPLANLSTNGSWLVDPRRQASIVPVG